MDPEEFEVPDENEIDLAAQVKGYSRLDKKTGKQVVVRGYVRTDMSAAVERARKSPGRPQVAAGSGRFPGDRSIPIWPDAYKAKKQEEEVDAGDEYEGMPKVSERNQKGLDEVVPVLVAAFKNQPQNRAMKKLIAILESASSVALSEVEDLAFDPEILELARRGVVRVAGYSYISKKTGQLVRVNPYTQIRRLMDYWGGTTLAARQGLTPDLFNDAMPGMDVKNKLFKAKKVDNAKSRKGPAANRQRATRGAAKAAEEAFAEKINKNPVNRTIDIPEPVDRKAAFTAAMRPSHPLESVRSSVEGSVVTKNGMSWQRGMDGLWHEQPNTGKRGLSDKQFTQKLVNKAGDVELKVANPISRKARPFSQPDYSLANPQSKNFQSEVRYRKALEPTFANLPEGIADSLNEHVVVRSDSRPGRPFTHTSVTKANNHYPKFTVNADPKVEADLVKTLPKQQREGYSVPSTLHPLEHAQARASAPFIEALFQNRAPHDMTDRMYDRLSAAYDHVIKDGGDYSALRGKDGWDSRLSGERDEALRGKISDRLSMSALNSAEDFLAEAWAEYVGNPQPRPLASAIGKAMEQSMDEFSDYLFKNNWADASEIPEPVYTAHKRTTISRKISDVLDGYEDNTIVTDLAPRDLRSILQSKSKYIDIRDSKGDPLFDAEVVQEGRRASINILSYPKAGVTTQPTGIPHPDNDPKQSFKPVIPDKENYLSKLNPGKSHVTFHEPEKMFKAVTGRENQRRYAEAINYERAQAALEAVEEQLSSEGVVRFDAFARGGEDSLVYARAGYEFEPFNTDVAEISDILNDMQMFLDTSHETAMQNYQAPPTKMRTQMQKRLNTWQKNLTDSPETWPLPKDIVAWGKTRESELSPGELAMMDRSWTGTKRSSFKAPKPKVATPAQKVEETITIVNPASRFEKFRTENNLPKAPASAVNAGARALRDGKLQPDGIRKVVEASLPEGHFAYVSHPQNMSTRIEVRKDKQHVFSFDLRRDADGYAYFENPNIPAEAWSDGRAYNVMQGLYSSMRVGEIKGIRVPAGPEHQRRNRGVFQYASEGYDWDGVPDKAQVADDLARGVMYQSMEVQNTLQRIAAEKSARDSTAQLLKDQKFAEIAGQWYEMQLKKQANALFEKFNSDPKGPTPFEISQLGRREALSLANFARMRMLPTGEGGVPSYRAMEQMLQEAEPEWHEKVAKKALGNVKPGIMTQGRAQQRAARQAAQQQKQAARQQRQAARQAQGTQTALQKQISQARPASTGKAPANAVQGVANQVVQTNALNSPAVTARLNASGNARRAPVPNLPAVGGGGRGRGPNLPAPVNPMPAGGGPNRPSTAGKTYGLGAAGSLASSPTAAVGVMQAAYDKWDAYQKGREGTALQQMFDFDGDATHDSFLEFAGKQALTMGTYALFKSMEGYWDWAVDIDNPSARKYTVSLIFMLLRLMPASLSRGALLTTANLITKRMSSPNPSDWPSEQEVEELLQDLSAQLPQGGKP